MPKLVIHFSSGLDENGDHEGGSWIADDEETACRFAAKLIVDRKVCGLAICYTSRYRERRRIRG
jgi:hypothetical protein